jgi:hypothetical protein
LQAPQLELAPFAVSFYCQQCMYKLLPELVVTLHHHFTVISDAAAWIAPAMPHPLPTGCKWVTALLLDMLPAEAKATQHRCPKNKPRQACTG